MKPQTHRPGAGDWSSLLVGLETLKSNPARTALSTLGIIMGVAALVSVLSLGDGMEQYSREQIEKTTDLQGISVTPSLFRTIEGQRFPRTDPVAFGRAELDSAIAAVGGRAAVRLALSGQALLTLPPDTSPIIVQIAGAIGGNVAEIPRVQAGRFPSDAELANDAPVAVVSAELAARMARGASLASIVGDTLTFDREHRVVVGVFEPSRKLTGATAIMPIGAARTALPPALVGRPSTILVTAARVEDVPAVRASIEAWLARRYGATWKERVSVASNESRVEQVAQAMFLFKLFMGAITGISLLVGGVGIMNVLLASVTERTREIGIRKATGARSRQILLQFLSESAVIAAAGSLIGVVLGTTGAFGVTTVMRKLTQAPMYAGFSFSTFAVAVLSSVTVGLVFGLYPALRAARLSPIEAIRHE